MAKLFKLIGVLLIIGAAALANVNANNDDDSIGEKDIINPVEALKPAVPEIERDERGILDYFKKEAPAAAAPPPEPLPAQGGYGFKTSYSYGGGTGGSTGGGYGSNTGVGYGSSSGGGYGSSTGGGYGISTGGGYGSSTGGGYGSSSSYKVSTGTGYGSGTGSGYGVSTGGSYVGSLGNGLGGGINIGIGTGIGGSSGGSGGSSYSYSSSSKTSYGGNSGSSYGEGSNSGYGNPPGYSYGAALTYGIGSGSGGIKTKPHGPHPGHGYGHKHGPHSSYGYPRTYNNPYQRGQTSSQGNLNFLLGAALQLPQYGTCQIKVLPPNVERECRNEQCDLTCRTGYKFPDGKVKLVIVCIGGTWTLKETGYVDIPPCQATCLPPCKNNGVCVEPGQCQCPETFTGPYCEHSNLKCQGQPRPPQNGRIHFSTYNTYTAECALGFRFPDGSNVTNVRCQNNEFIYLNTGLAKIPKCEPICTPDCANGGACITPGTCDCGSKFRGDRCQYSIDNCNFTKIGFFGSIQCGYRTHEVTCKLNCYNKQLQMELKSEGRLDINYTCKYDQGEFLPKPYPRCILPPGYEVGGYQQTSFSSKTSGKNYSANLQYEFRTEHEKIIEILTKYREYEERSEWWSMEETNFTPNSYSLYVDASTDVIQQIYPKPAFCTTWGGVNLKTFDGLVIKAPISCSHTLINDKQDGSFSVTLKGCPYGSGYGCAHSLQIWWESIVYTFENQNGTVHIYSDRKTFPSTVRIKGMRLINVAQHFIIELESFGLKIDWDLHQYVGVYASPALWSRVGGLCGSLDGDYKNDLMTKTGKVVQTVKSFTDSWRVDDTSEMCTMDNSVEVEFDTKSCDPDKRRKAFAICERLLANEKLDGCLKFFNFESLVRTCVEDYCHCAEQKHPETCNCDAMSMLAKECAFKGVKLEHGWRNLEICPITCKNGRVYRPCGPDVEMTCDSQDIEPTKGKCIEGCFCPEGTVQYKDTCISQELCPCVHGRREYKPDQTRKEKCNKCTCKSGKWECTNETCGARCGAIGDPHYQTFDGKRFDFMGKCSYYLLKMANISVEAENVACSGAISENLNLEAAENPSCTKSVTVKFVQKNGVATSVKLHQGLVTHINGKEVTKFPKIVGSGELLIRRASDTFLTVEFPGGIRVWWDGVSRVYIDAPPKLMGQTAGLCGNFNAKTDDDFYTPEGDIETSVEAFADKWRTKDTCDFMGQTELNPHPCTAHPEKKAEAEKHCAWIMDDIFQDCHWTVAPEQYYEDCLYDVCACKDDPAKCYCPILSAYGTECMREGVKTGWRMAVKECAVKCPLGQVYDECGDSCALSCEDLTRRATCKRECVEGCRCPHDEFLNEDNECVPKAKCHCSFDGMNFNPGYKEVRPGSRVMDICTCQEGIWECDEAQPGDEIIYPPSSELRAECARRPFATFSKCVAKEPKTCKNMHEYTVDYEDCVPGCECMEGYVFDVVLKMCVLPEKCSCHHAGKSYNDGEKMKEDCNTCVCQAGNWKCSTNGCASTCSVWGDSHFTTFDSNDFDFQGECDYILSKGAANNGDTFTITIQNVLCGTMGVTCSKSVEIALAGSVQDTLTLAGDSTYLEDPNKSVMSKLRDAVNTKSHSAFHVYRAGVFIVVEVPSLHLQVKWDEGTRVYVKLGNEWKNKVSGLCGNYNDNAIDDMTSPSQALESNALTFGHSWRVQKYCVMPTQPIDACKAHPERETWAQLKCGVLKSNIFKDCHAEVPVEKYLKRCIFDTCACDQGGDCECLCTAVAAYAHICSQKGINIRWRTPHFCPMQCDPHCAEYKACTPACPVETCDNFLEQSTIDHMCKTENCMEGCRIKPCDEGMIYSNDTYRECVPKSDCKPVCMIKNGTTFYEGDVTYQDECSTCRCSRRKEVCTGVKCTAEVTTPRIYQGTTLAPLKEQEQSKCIKGWTRWYDDDTDPSTREMRLNDVEKLPRYSILETVYGMCKKEFMTKIECRVVNTHESSDFMNENVFCNLNDGLTCVGNCHDYEIRVFCQCDPLELTTPAPTEKPQTGQSCNNEVIEYKEYPGDCHRFLHCQPKVDGGWHYVDKTCGESMMFNPTINVCDHIATVQEIKPDCKQVDEHVIITKCVDGQVWSECANQCEHSCHYYGMVLRKRGLCVEGEHCKPGCVDAKRPNCPAEHKYWRDDMTCVQLDECPCMDNTTEAYVQPFKPFIGEKQTCQCLDNVYTCAYNKWESGAVFQNVTYEEEVSQDLGLILHSTVTPPAACRPQFMIPIIEGVEPLPDSVFNASSSLGPNYLPAMARLTTKSKSAWSPMINDQLQYLQINLKEPEPLYGIRMAGNPEFNNFVTLYRIFYSTDGVSHHLLTDSNSNNPQLFNGPLDSREPYESLFKTPIEAKSLKIYPLKWHNSIAMRVELLGCDHVEVTTAEYRITPTTEHPIVNLDFEPVCSDKMGVLSDKMDADQVKASSIWQSSMTLQKPRLIDLLKLSSPLGWKPVVNSPNEYVEFDFLEPRNITGFITKGGPDGWVSSYKVMFSKNKLIWNTALDMKGKHRLFHGNHDKLTEQIKYLHKPMVAQYVKIVPYEWVGNINMRVEPLGCYKEYLIIPKNESKPEIPEALTKCNICEGVVALPLIDGSCRCNETLYWDGSNCVRGNLCPCVENFIPYPIGSKFENKNCEECVCVLGGQSSCKPKKCPPCENKLMRPVVGAGCYCKCEPCPKHQRICPSSGDCIPEALWCNGVNDCADDEDASCIDIQVVTSKPITTESQVKIYKCPVPECPPKMKMKITEKKERKMSSMFSSTYTEKVTVKHVDGKTIKSKVITSSQEYADGAQETGSGNLMQEEEEECEEFTCVPIKEVTINRNQTFSCTEPKCPENYKAELDMSSVKRGECPGYTCILKPRKDDVCEISGKSFITFDGTEFKYDTCSHILARDLVSNAWTISVHLECIDSSRKICRKMITIRDLERGANLTIKPKMRLDYNGFEYSVQQLINSPQCKASFVISQVGDTVLVVSPQRGYWVLYDDIGYIKVGISSKFIKTVDGLCGYYDGIASNDKRTPDGSLLQNTAKFGESWFDNETPKDQCYPQTCPLDLQKKALALCNTVKHPTFVKCGKSVNHKQFASKCMETTCECLRSSNGDVNTCKCNILQDFVKKCLAVNPDAHMNTWRAVHQCEISCPAPLVHSDCYKRRCEPSCESLNSDDCAIIPGACFSGCYCPEGTVRKGDTCVPIAECKDCLCNTVGSTQYFTYDRQDFAFEGNCSYLLSRDIVLPGVHTFQVYVTMADCRKLGKLSAPPHSSCAQALHIINGAHVVHIQRQPNVPKSLQVLVDSFNIKRLPYTDNWISLRELSGKEIVLILTEAYVEVKAAIDDLTFSVGVPSVKYASKLEGLCGNCDRNPDNDLVENPAQVKRGQKPSTELAVIVQSWKSNEPKLGLNTNECMGDIKIEKIEECLTPEPEQDPCMIMLLDPIFSRCNMIVDPVPFIKTCQRDRCKNKNTTCESIAAFAKECTRAGICVNWRTENLCPYACPLDQKYLACGCSKSCDSLQILNEFQAINMNTNTIVNTVSSEELCPITESYEGCFCPEGKVLEKGKCISNEMCVKCEDVDRTPGERWQKDKCTECLCDKHGKTQCVEHKCLVEQNICAEGHMSKEKHMEGECCPRLYCIPEMKPVGKLCLEPLMPQCGPGQFLKVKNGTDGCTHYMCECKPKSECDLLIRPILQDGEELVVDETGCCPIQHIKCDKTKCPTQPEPCVEELWEHFQRPQGKDCCPSFFCAPPKNLCILVDEQNKKYTVKVNEKWVNSKNPCLTQQCAYGPNDSTQVLTTTETCNTNCSLGYEYIRKDTSKCCGECVNTRCVLDGKLYEPGMSWKSADNCTTFSCAKKGEGVIVSTIKEQCPDVSKCPKHLLKPVNNSCCLQCMQEPVKEDLSNCLPVSLAETETRNMVKVQNKHGICTNDQPIKGFTECVGSCNSGSKYNRATWTQDKICNCCNIKSHKLIAVPLLCEDGVKITKELEIPSSCGCQPCSDSVEYQTAEQIDIRLHNLPLSQIIMPNNRR